MTCCNDNNACFPLLPTYHPCPARARRAYGAHARTGALLLLRRPARMARRVLALPDTAAALARRSGMARTVCAVWRFALRVYARGEGGTQRAPAWRGSARMPRRMARAHTQHAACRARLYRLQHGAHGRAACPHKNGIACLLFGLPLLPAARAAILTLPNTIIE